MSKIASGRPLRFFVILMGGWTVVRLASATSGMWGSPMPAAPPRSALATLGSLAHHSARATPVQSTAEVASSYYSPSKSFIPRLLAHAFIVPVSKASGAARFGPIATSRMAIAPASSPQEINTKSLPPAPLPGPAPTAVPAVPLAQPGQPPFDRWRGSAWALWREGSATPANAVTAGRLGGSQAGLRIDYDLTPRASGRVAAYGRFSTAMNRPASPEAALGLAWQPVRTVPISIAGERRIALGDGARNANALLVVGGFGPVPVTAGVEAEAYAQTGMVGFRRRDLFVDGKLSLLAPLAHSPLRLGGSISGGAQPQVERLDVGPELQLRLPLPRIATRLSMEWRERVAGQAAPASGMAVTLGADF